MTSWVRLWHDMPTDPKWRVIARKSGQRVGDVIAVFNFLMVSASANADERGRTQNVVCEDLAAALDLSESDVEAIITAMTGKVITEDGYLTGWEKRQPKREDSSAERAKAWRDERKRTQANAQERPDADADADTELKKEKATPSPKKGTRLSMDWKPSADDVAFAAQHLTPEAMRHEADQFRDFWIAKPGAGGVKLDWPATWRGWVRRAGKSPAKAAGKHTGGNGRGAPDMAEIARRRSEERRQVHLSSDGWIPTGVDGVCVLGPDAGSPPDRFEPRDRRDDSPFG